MTKPSIRHLVKEELGKVPHFCIYALLEWVLIVLLFINGFVGFLATQFAKYCELRSPCLVCSRIDHVLAERDEDFHYNETMCELHMRDVSYLAYCHNHKKLSDIRRMCEACLLSFATEKESDGDTYKSLVGILHKDLECFVEDQNQIHLSLGKNTEDALQMGRSSVQRCSCCGMHLKLKIAGKGKNVNQLLTAAPVPSSPPQAPVDLPLLRLEEDQLQLVREDSKTNVPLLGDGEETPSFSNKFPDSATSTTSPRLAGGRTLSRRSTLDMVEFGSEDIEGNVASEEDESILHRLKRQVRLDRKSLMALYMELDEERNASAVAANNAMAMITRLQAEKAAVQMETLQYQRMMEEQAEYDQEALQETQKIIRDLENELEAYRHKFGYLEGFETDKDFVEPELDYQDMSSETPLIATPSFNERSTPESLESRNDDEVITISLDGSKYLPDDESQVGTSLQDFDEERSQVLDQLKTSEPEMDDAAANDLPLQSCSDVNGDDTQEGTVNTPNMTVKDLDGERSQVLDQLKTSEDKVQPAVHDEPLQSCSDVNGDDTQEETDSVNTPNMTENPKAFIARELSFLNERLHSLEAHGARTLQNGGDGAELLEEISENIQKLRRLMSMPVDT